LEKAQEDANAEIREVQNLKADLEVQVCSLHSNLEDKDGVIENLKKQQAAQSDDAAVVQTLQAELAAKTEEIANMKSKANEAFSQLQEEVQQKTDELNNLKNNEGNALQKLQAEVKEALEKLEASGTENDKLVSEVNQQKSHLAQQASTLSEKEGRIAELQQEQMNRPDTSDAIEKLQNELSQKAVEIATVKADAAQKSNLVDQLRIAKEQSEFSTASMKDEIQKLRQGASEIPALREQINKLKNTVQAPSPNRSPSSQENAIIMQLRSELDSMRSLMDATKNRSNNNLSPASNGAELKDITRKLDDKSSEVIRLQSINENLQREVNVMREQARNGNNKGSGASAYVDQAKEQENIIKIVKQLRYLFSEEIGPVDDSRINAAKIDSILEDVSGATQKIKLERRHLGTLVESLRLENGKLKNQVDMQLHQKQEGFWTNLYKCKLFPPLPGQSRDNPNSDVNLSILRHVDDGL